MGSLNKVMLIGNLGKDPEVRTTPQGAKVASFSIATTESYTDKSGTKHDKTEWHNVVLWRGLAEITEKYLRKGSMVYVEGKLQTRSWDDKQSGGKRYATEVVVDNLVMLGGGGHGGNTGGQTGNSAKHTIPNGDRTYQPSSLPPQAEDDLPF